MVVPRGSVPKECVAAKMIMAHTPLKSFSINSLLPETVVGAGSPTPDDDDTSKLEAHSDQDVDVGSDCESEDLDVTGTTPPLDCSGKSNDDEKESEADGKFCSILWFTIEFCNQQFYLQS